MQKQDTRISVLVTDGDQRATLALVRALGREGIPVTVGSTESTSLAGSSRYCAERFQYPSPIEKTNEFRSCILDQVRTGRHRILLPMTDITQRLIGEMRQE